MSGMGRIADADARASEMAAMTPEEKEELALHGEKVAMHMRAMENMLPPPSPRSSWDEYFMTVAVTAATRATCDRKHVGAVIVRDKSILATGYNGSIRGMPHCDDVGHLMEDTHCVRTAHAEANAVAQAARNGVAIKDATIYVTASPCFGCFKLIINAGCTRIVYGEAYRIDEHVLHAAHALGIDLAPLHHEA